MTGNTYAEQCVLGAALLDAKNAMTIADALGPEMFTDPLHRELFNAVSSLYWAGEAVDVVKLVNQFPDKKAYLVELAETASVNQRLDDYIQILQENWQASALSDSLRAIVEGGGSAGDMLSKLEELTRQQRALLDIRGGSGMSTFMEAFVQFKDWLTAQRTPTIGTGYGQLDASIGGLMPGSVFTLAARPGGGKTDFALTLAMNAARNGARVLYFSMEMTTLQLMQRVVSRLLRINSVRIRDRNLTAEELGDVEQLTEAIRAMGKLSFIDEARVSTGKVWHYVEMYHPQFVVIDHIGLMKRPDMRDQYRALGKVSNDLKQIALKEKITVLQLAQMNRQIENRKDSKPNLSDLRESGDLEQDSDFVGFLNPQTVKGQVLKGNDYADVFFHLAKNRHAGERTLRFQWQPQYHSYTEVEERYGE